MTALEKHETIGCLLESAHEEYANRRAMEEWYSIVSNIALGITKQLTAFLRRAFFVSATTWYRHCMKKV